MGEDNIGTCSIDVYTPVLKLSILFLNLDEYLSTVLGQMGFFGLNAKSSLWMNTDSFSMK
jgi:hypothetical protein